MLIREGEPGDRFFVLLSGIAGVTQSALGERRILRAGEFFGEVALAMHVPRTATVTAMTPCVVASCDEAAFDELVRPLFADGSSGRARRATESAKRGHASFAQSPNSRVVSAAQTTRASGSTQRNVPEPPKWPNVRGDVRLPIHDGGRGVELHAEPPVEGIESAVIREDAGKARELDGDHLVARLVRDESWNEELAPERQHVAE